ncbi:MAG: hypothetical protein KatS3mg131_1476 [Candidatus Tectimicrobiota bacterium]|nr:MAG: hypothetical protein KatS3mg131_1476 [Candidatus Tectomicrobia bacterium]
MRRRLRGSTAWWRWGLLGGLLLALVACAGKTPRVPEAKVSEALPEVTRITFQGNTHFSSRALRRVMAIRPRPLWPPWRRGEPYNPPTLAADLRRLKKFYFDRGFLQAQVRLAAVHESAEGTQVQLEIAIDEGPETRVAAVQLAGTLPPELPPAPQLLAALPLRAGMRLSKAAFDQSRELLRERLHAAGYARARVIPHTEIDLKTHAATVTFTLEPGKRATVGRLTIRGARQVRETAIRRQLTLCEGEVFSSTRLRESLEAIYGLGMFQAVTPHLQRLEEPDAPLDVVIEVRERRPRSVEVGFGFSTVERFRLQTAWTHRNLFGGAQRFSATGKVSSLEQTLEARLRLPAPLGRRTALTQTFFVRNEQEINTDPLGLSDALFDIKDPQPAFDLLRLGANAELTYRLSRRLSVLGGLELSLNQFRNVDPQALASVGPGLGEDNLLLVQFGEAQWNSSDHPLDPTRGLVLRGRLEHATTAMLSDTSFVKAVVEVRHYLRLWRQLVLATRLELGSLQPYGASDEAPFNVRFFAGGPGQRARLCPKSPRSPRCPGQPRGRQQPARRQRRTALPPLRPPRRRALRRFWQRVSRIFHV